MGLPTITDPSEVGLPKSDHSFPVTQETDLSAAEYEQLAVDLCAMTHTAPRAWVQVFADSTSPAIQDHEAHWGDSAVLKPTLARGGAGSYTLTWATAYNDLNPTPARQVSRSVNIRGVIPVLCHRALPMEMYVAVGSTIAARILASNQIEIMTKDGTGAMADIDFFVAVF